jgi:RNA polymerase sigma factor, sigma-70 family
MLFMMISLIQEDRPDRDALERILEALACGKKEAVKDLYEQCSQAVFAYALSLLRNTHDAEDVLHDCIIKVWESAPRYQNRGKPMAWILTIAKNLCISKLRTAKDSIPLTETELSADTGALSAEERILLESCMNSLDDSERQIVVLHAVSGMKHREIAKLLRLPLGTVLSKYRRAILKLKKRWEQEESV